MKSYRRKCLVAAVVVGVLVLPSAATAAVSSPGWTLDSVAGPTNFSSDQNQECLARVGTVPLGSCDSYQVSATNAGSEPTDGTAVTVSDTLPPGLTVQRIQFFWSGAGRLAQFLPGFSGKTDLNVAIPENFGGPPPCTEIPVGGLSTTPALTVSCTLPEIGFPVNPDETLQVVIYATVNESGASGVLTNAAEVSGGGARKAVVSRTNSIAEEPASFGPANFEFLIAGRDGAPDTQAGDHPYELTTTIDLNNRISSEISPPVLRSTEDVKDVVVDLPLGFAGSVLAAPECTLAGLASEQRCPASTQIGHILSESAKGVEAIDSPVWNLVPERGEPAEFGFVDGNKNTHVFYARVVPTAEGYAVRVTSADIPQAVLYHIVVTIYGDPAEKNETGNLHLPFFTNPSSCSGRGEKAAVHMDSWQHPGRQSPDGGPDLTDPRWVSDEAVVPAVIGCNELQFSSELKAQPTTSVADSPSGLDFELKIPQPQDVLSRATPPLRKAVVTLPEGFTVDPSAGDGLAGCSESQIGWLGGSVFNFSPAAPECPDASKIAALEVESPLLPGVVTGAVYLARQNENPFGSVFAAYIVVNDPATGVIVKIPGELKSDPSTGRITSLFAESPQLPVSDLKLHFFGGPRGTLATPESCGVFSTTSDLSPWSAPDSGPDATPFDVFSIGSGCVGGFAPSFTAGTTSAQAGAYGPFVASLSRSDADQELGGLSVSLPRGLLANVASVPLCPDAQASSGTCPESSRVGTVTAAAGPGPNPLFESGRAYLTGPYKGGPYGLSVVVPAIAGPFDFGNVVVRQSLHIDPTDAHVTDVSDPFPRILNATGTNGETVGVPIRLRRVDVAIDRPGFTFNPTSCAKMQTDASVTDTRGTPFGVGVPFQAANCAALKFGPKFAVSTPGKTSKASGAGLSVRVIYPSGPQGTYANIGKVKVELPKQLPSRLSTLQKACLAAVFDANPANCPPGSVVGHAKAITPILPAPMEGPAYFVSHGNEAFPDLVLVLQGNGVTIDLVGSTLIRHGITSNTFAAVPDAPVSSFTLTLPQGANSALAANTNLCKASSKMIMPTTFVAQNGIELHQATKIAVTGCSKAKKHKKAQGKHGRRKSHKRRHAK